MDEDVKLHDYRYKSKGETCSYKAFDITANI